MKRYRARPSIFTQNTRWAGLCAGGIAFLASRDGQAQIVSDCNPSTVVAAATGARRALLEKAVAYWSCAPDYSQSACLDVDSCSVTSIGSGCSAPSEWRTDCSGFISYVWNLSSSYTTYTLKQGGTDSHGTTWVQKSWAALEPGDAVNWDDPNPDLGHVRLFTGWLDAAHTHYCVLAESQPGATDSWGGLGCIAHSSYVSSDQSTGYVPIGLAALPTTTQVTEHDVDGDGRADLVSVTDNGYAYVWPGQASGAFGTGVPSFAGTLDAANMDGSGHFIVGVGDVTGDGKADLVSVAGNGNAYVWPGQSGGSFGSAVSSFAGTLDAANVDGSGHLMVAVADVTGDGKADLVSVTDNGYAYVWPGQSSGAFTTGVPSFAGTLDAANMDGTGHFIVGVADVTGDGKADLVSVTDNGYAYVWPGQSSGGFGTAVSSFAGTLDAANIDGAGHLIVGVADVDGDGKADLVSVTDNGYAYVWPGQSSGAFATAVPSFAGTLDAANIDGTGHLIVGLADITGDGKADLVSVTDSGDAYVWPGQASGAFGTAVSSFAGTLDAANIDGTGHYIVSPSTPGRFIEASASSSASSGSTSASTGSAGGNGSSAGVGGAGGGPSTPTSGAAGDDGSGSGDGNGSGDGGCACRTATGSTGGERPSLLALAAAAMLLARASRRRRG